MPADRRSRGRKKSKRKPQTSIGFPNQRSVKLRYLEATSVDPSAGGTAIQQFRANDCHDPNLTGVGHQPYLWDEWKQFYNHYVVMGSKISVQACVDTTANQSPIVVGIYLSDDATTSTNFVALCEKGLTHYKVVPQGRQEVVNLSYTFSAKDFFSLKDVRDNVDRIGAATTQSPTEIAVFNVFAAALDGASNPPQCDLLCTLDYSVAFSEPQELGQS